MNGTRINKLKHRIVTSVAGLVLAVGVMGISGCGDGNESSATTPKSELSQLIINEDFERANEYINNHDMSKTEEDKLLSHYVNLRYGYEKQKEDGTINYEKFQKNLDNVLTPKLSVYTGELKESIASFIETVEVEKRSYSNDQENLKREKIAEMFKNKEYEEIRKDTFLTRDENPESNALYYFSLALESQSKNDIEMMKYYLNMIPFNYDGFYSKDIKNQKLSHGSEDKWKYEGKPPVVGMTTSQLKLSSWGEPKDINKTITSGSVSEQWVYGDGKYIYLDDGIVTAIQE